MTLKELLAISDFDGYTVWVKSEPDPVTNIRSHIDGIYVQRHTAPDYKGPFYGKSHREEKRVNVQKLKKYAGCEVFQIKCGFHDNPVIYVLEAK